jgi:hypothetical protein
VFITWVGLQAAHEAPRGLRLEKETSCPSPSLNASAVLDAAEANLKTHGYGSAYYDRLQDCRQAWHTSFGGPQNPGSKNRDRWKTKLRQAFRNLTRMKGWQTWAEWHYRIVHEWTPARQGVENLAPLAPLCGLDYDMEKVATVAVDKVMELLSRLLPKVEDTDAVIFLCIYLFTAGSAWKWVPHGGGSKVCKRWHGDRRALGLPTGADYGLSVPELGEDVCSFEHGTSTQASMANALRRNEPRSLVLNAGAKVDVEVLIAGRDLAWVSGGHGENIMHAVVANAKFPGRGNPIRLCTSPRDAGNSSFEPSNPLSDANPLGIERAGWAGIGCMWLISHDTHMVPASAKKWKPS